MGLFSRKEPASGTGRRPASRSSLSSEAQASELRGRARRRLIGALALVLAAVIVVPMLFDSSEPLEQASTPVVMPAIVPPTPAENLVQPADSGEVVAQPDASVAAPADPASGTIAQAETPMPTETEQVPAPEADPAPEVVADASSKAPPEPKPVEKPEAKPKPKPSTERTDDGSVAIALLEGRTPSKPAAASGKGNFILQIAAYTNDKDAEVRRDRLASAGVTNAYVENAVSGGKTTYRLRVGPFPTRDAAQAAQARLRALGYDNGFISTK